MLSAGLIPSKGCEGISSVPLSHLKIVCWQEHINEIESHFLSAFGQWSEYYRESLQSAPLLSRLKTLVSTNTSHSWHYSKLSKICTPHRNTIKHKKE
jgi:hypothetical protein